MAPPTRPPASPYDLLVAILLVLLKRGEPIRMTDAELNEAFYFSETGTHLIVTTKTEYDAKGACSTVYEITRHREAL